MKFEVTILGSNSAIPAFGRHPSAQVLSYHNKKYLIDCGEGTQMRLQNMGISPMKIDAIFISHLHGDHYFGLIGLLTSLSLLRRPTALQVFGHKGLKNIIELQLDNMGATLSYKLDFHEIVPDQSAAIFETEHLTVSTFPVSHRIPCNAFVFREKPAKLRYNTTTADPYRVPVEWIKRIKEGEDYVTPNGVTVPNKDLTLPPLPQRSYAYVTDTEYLERILPEISKVDLFYHEATFNKNGTDRAAMTFHSTTHQAAKLAKLGAVNKLIIGHFSAKYKDLAPLLEEAKEIFENTELAIEGTTFTLERE